MMSKEGGNEYEESTLLQDQYDYEEEETLSLCDLPNSTISPQSGDFSNYHHDDDDDNLFEFFSEEFTTSRTHYDDNIIFCGKLIPFKDNPKPKLISKASLKIKGKQEEVKGSLNIKSFDCDYTSMGGKVSLVRCATKSRWFLFLFGLSLSSRLSSKEMQLSDIRSRQRRREPAAMFAVAPGSGKEVVKSKKNEKSCKGMWKVLRSISLVLGCRSNKLANDVVKAAFV